MFILYDKGAHVCVMVQIFIYDDKMKLRLKCLAVTALKYLYKLLFEMKPMAPNKNDSNMYFKIKLGS